MTMNKARFRRLADVYGGSLDRWPEKDRVDAQVFLEHDLEARFILNDEAALDRLIALGEPYVGDADVARLQLALSLRLNRRKAAQPHVIAHEIRPSGRETWNTVGFLAMMIVAGFLAGRTGLMPDRSGPHADLMALAPPNSYLMAWNK